MKTVLITGASRGIGKAAAEKFAKEGYALFLCCKNSADELRDRCTQITDKYEVDAHPLICDIAVPAQVEAMFKDIRKMTSHLDVLINNAGVAFYGLIQDTAWRDWQKIMNTNIGGTFLCCREAVSMMLPNKSGSIVNISSVWGIEGASFEVAYSASKGAVCAFTKALAKELEPSGINVNAIAFGAVDTDMIAHLTPEERREIERQSPRGRLTTPAEVAEKIFGVAAAPPGFTGDVVVF